MNTVTDLRVARIRRAGRELLAHTDVPAHWEDTPVEDAIEWVRWRSAYNGHHVDVSDYLGFFHHHSLTAEILDAAVDHLVATGERALVVDGGRLMLVPTVRAAA